ncbi:MAG: MarR family transcriptional regulator [Sulfurospirillaceae bacterium]|nr:MarR family transcriptional regulator [Sulfurospirillaceae bacterium]
MNESVQNSIGFRIARTANKINQTITSLLSEDGIAIEQRILLEILSSCDQANQTTLATILNKSATTISRTLDSLEKKGFIVKKSIKGDKRVNVIEVSSHGKAILKSTEDKVIAFRNTIAQKLTLEEKELLFSLLDKLS